MFNPSEFELYYDGGWFRNYAGPRGIAELAQNEKNPKMWSVCVLRDGYKARTLATRTTLEKAERLARGAIG